MKQFSDGDVIIVTMVTRILFGCWYASQLVKMTPVTSPELAPAMLDNALKHGFAAADRLIEEQQTIVNNMKEALDNAGSK